MRGPSPRPVVKDRVLGWRDGSRELFHVPEVALVFLERTATPIACPDGVYEPRPGYPATCTGGERNGFYGAGNVNALNAVQ